VGGKRRVSIAIKGRFSAKWRGATIAPARATAEEACPTAEEGSPMSGYGCPAAGETASKAGKTCSMTGGVCSTVEQVPPVAEAGSPTIAWVRAIIAWPPSTEGKACSTAGGIREAGARAGARSAHKLFVADPFILETAQFVCESAAAVMSPKLGTSALHLDRGEKSRTPVCQFARSTLRLAQLFDSRRFNVVPGRFAPTRKRCNASARLCALSFTKARFL